MLPTLFAVQPRTTDPLTLRQGYVLARLMPLMALIAALQFTGTIFANRPVWTWGLGALTPAICLVTYAINRTGRVRLAVNVLLTGLALLPTIIAIVLGTPIPSIYLTTLVVVVAAAFGKPRDPLIWAALLSGTPFLVNAALYGSLLPPSHNLFVPGNVFVPPILILEITALGLLWGIAGVTYLSTRLLTEVLAESRAAEQAAAEARQALAQEQAALANQNSQLIQMRRNLEELVEALTVPVVPLANGIGLLPLVGPIDNQRMHEVERQTLNMVAASRMHALILDLSGAAALDVDGTQSLVRLCQALRLLGVTPLLAGLGARNALLLSGSALQMPRTVATVQDALALLAGSANGAAKHRKTSHGTA